MSMLAQERSLKALDSEGTPIMRRGRLLEDGESMLQQPSLRHGTINTEASPILEATLNDGVKFANSARARYESSKIVASIFSETQVSC